ncbi:MAG: hypothetical protein KA052_00725 [Candidatus Pacebacteria bacterium]|nr:hypothetical protein [Candidatus Paceibacterota bacterium]
MGQTKTTRKMNRPLRFLVALFHRIVYGYYDNEPVEKTFENLKKFVYKYNKYNLVALVPLAEESKRRLATLCPNFDDLPEGIEKEIIGAIITCLKAYYFTDDLERTHNAVQQRVTRVEAKLFLGEWAHVTGSHGKKLNPHRRQKYANMLALWDSNRMRRTNSISLLQLFEDFCQSGVITCAEDTKAIAVSLRNGPFKRSDRGTNGYEYDYMPDAEKAGVKDTTDEFYFLLIRDLLKSCRKQMG